jgi:GTPase SAR1 family protein
LYQPNAQSPTEKETTSGIAIHKHEFKMMNGRTFRLNVWDFGGQQIHHATHQFFLTCRSLDVLIDDTRKDYKSVSDEGSMYWDNNTEDLLLRFGDQLDMVIEQSREDKTDRSSPAARKS